MTELGRARTGMGEETGLTAAARDWVVVGMRDLLGQIRDANSPEVETECEYARVETMRLLRVPLGWKFMRRKGGRSILCLRCFCESHHPEDVKRLYCGRCHVFHAPSGGDEEGLTG